MLSQARPNIFTTAVANIGPGETVIIQLEYQQVVQRQGRIYSLRFPMVIGPRYTQGLLPLLVLPLEMEDGRALKTELLIPNLLPWRSSPLLGRMNHRLIR